MKKIFIFIIFFLNNNAFADHTKTDRDLINLMSKNTNTEIGINLILKHEYEKAIDYFTKAAENKDMDSAANLGLIFEYLKNNIAKAEEYYILSASYGNAYGQYNLGILNFIVKKDKKNGYKWISCAANQGYLLAIEAKSSPASTLSLKTSASAFVASTSLIAEGTSRTCLASHCSSNLTRGPLFSSSFNR